MNGLALQIAKQPGATGMAAAQGDNIQRD